MATTTPRQDLPIPTSGDDPDIVADLNSLAVAIEKRLFGVYDDTADRDARNSSPEEGQVAFHKDTNRVYCYYDSAWNQIYPQTFPAITSGTSAPSGGSNGDVYFQV